jgi:hypothetical protein
MKYNLVVFTYDTPHRKTHDILIDIYLSGINNVLVIGAPLVKLKNISTDKIFTPISCGEPLHPKDICKRFNYQYVVCPHNDFLNIRNCLKNYGANIAIISGARILHKNIIEIFDYGVINYHPGLLPDTSGLDSLYWMLMKLVRPSATCHFIDHRVDAGFLIKEQDVRVSQSDTIEIVSHKIYLAQIELNKYICNSMFRGVEFKSTPILRIDKNSQMENLERISVLRKFPLWKKKYAYS